MILWRDARCVVVDKPAGVATHRGWADDDDEPLLQRVRDTVGCHVYPVHRLDRGASGAILFALDSASARAFSEAWPTADKRYLAITRGHPPEHLVIDHAVPRAPGEARVAAVTEVRRLAVAGRYALVEARPRTGRLHQIRRHLKHVSCPLIGDVRYGKGEHNRLFRERHALHRLALHCASLTVAHPDGGQLAVACALAPDLAAAWQSVTTETASRSGSPSTPPLPDPAGEA
nr:pseudouridine synthase [Kofleriaceae bacterium]